MNKPRAWPEFEELSRQEARLWELARVRLIELFFTQDNATAIRAIEILQGMSSDELEDDFADVPLEELRALRERARRFIEAGTNGHKDDDDGDGAA